MTDMKKRFNVCIIGVPEEETEVEYIFLLKALTGIKRKQKNPTLFKN